MPSEMQKTAFLLCWADLPLCAIGRAHVCL